MEKCSKPHPLYLTVEEKYYAALNSWGDGDDTIKLTSEFESGQFEVICLDPSNFNDPLQNFYFVIYRPTIGQEKRTIQRQMPNEIAYQILILERQFEEKRSIKILPPISADRYFDCITIYKGGDIRSSFMDFLPDEHFSDMAECMQNYTVVSGAPDWVLVA